MKALATLCVSSCLMLLFGCATPQQQADADRVSVKAWLNGPFATLCSDLPGLDSHRACIMVIERLLLETDGTQLSREEHYKIELTKYRSAEDIRQRWTVADHEAWLRGPYTAACNKAPLPGLITNCLASVQRDLDILALRGHEAHEDSPEVRAERAVSRIESQRRDRATAAQREHELDLARTQAAGMILQGYAFRGGPLSNSMQQAPVSSMQPVVPLYTPAPMMRSAPPVSCSSTVVGGYTHTSCY